MALCHPSPAIVRLVKALGLDPDTTRSVSLNLAVNDVVVVRTEQYASGEQIEGVAAEIEAAEYVLVPKSDDATAGREGRVTEPLPKEKRA